MKVILKAAIITAFFHFAHLAGAAISFQSYQLNTSGPTILPNPFANLEALGGNEFCISVTSLNYAPTSLSLFIGGFPTLTNVYSISSSPVVSHFVGDPLLQSSGFVAFYWKETFFTSFDLVQSAEQGQLFFSYFDNTSAQRTDRFYRTIPEPSGLALGVLAFSIAVAHRRRIT